tara:strand:+ start:867 stop:1601 length:735 start_codon:yes stop_codon:yes gene_type:complete
MIPWAICKEHDPANLTTLCPTHHAQATSGLLDGKLIEKANASNSRSISSPYALNFHGDNFIFRFAGTDWSSEGKPQRFDAIVIDDNPQIGCDFIDGKILLNMIIFDNCQNPILISNQGFVQYIVNYWDIKWSGRRLRLRDKPKHIRLDIEFIPPNLIYIRRGLFLLNGIAIQVFPNGIYCHNNGNQMRFGDSVGGDCEAGTAHQIALGFGYHHNSKTSAAVSMHGLKRYQSFDLFKSIKAIDIS